MTDVTCYTMISHDVNLLRWCVSNAKERAGIEHDWLLIHWVNVNQTKEEIENIRQASDELGMRYHRFDATDLKDHPNRTQWFLSNLYRGWNLGYEQSNTPWVARMGSDQFFSKGWLAELMRAADQHGERALYHCWTVESLVANHSRHEVIDFGSTPDEFDVFRFDQYADELTHKYSSRNCLTPGETRLYFNHPYRGIQIRTDGCTWLQHKSLWEEFGPLSNKINKEGVTGDVSYMDSMYDAGLIGYLVAPSTCYHLVRGESRETQE